MPGEETGPWIRSGVGGGVELSDGQCLASANGVSLAWGQWRRYAAALDRTCSGVASMAQSSRRAVFSVAFDEFVAVAESIPHSEMTASRSCRFSLFAIRQAFEEKNGRPMRDEELVKAMRVTRLPKTAADKAQDARPVWERWSDDLDAQGLKVPEIKGGPEVSGMSAEARTAELTR